MKTLSRYKRLSNIGLCPQCGIKPPLYGFKLCYACRMKMNERHTQHRYKLIEHGICDKCRKETDRKGKFLCFNCLRESKNVASKLREHRRTNSLCVVCGEKSENLYCYTCREDRNRKLTKSRLVLKNLILDAYGRKCACCGETIERFLQLDHIKNDGALERADIGRNCYVLYRRLQKEGFPKLNYQILCANCNFGKGKNGGVCPHEEIRQKNAGFSRGD